MQKLEQKALDEYIPVIQPEVVQLLRVMLTSVKAENMLEIGTAIGYSALIFAEILPENGKITTIELKEDTAQVARENIKKPVWKIKLT